METSQYRLKNALTNYGRVLFICAVVVLCSLYFKVPTNILTIKILIVPMFWLSYLGLNSIFKHPIIEEKITLRMIEYFAIWAFLFSAFMIVTIWTPDISVLKMMSTVLLGTAIGTVLQLVLAKVKVFE